MAEVKEFYELIGRVSADPSFRDQVAADPHAAAGSLGFTLTSDQANALRALSRDVYESMVKARGPRVGLDA